MDAYWLVNCVVQSADPNPSRLRPCRLTTVKRVSVLGTTISAPRSGRPKIHNDRGYRRIMHFIRWNPLATYETLAAETDLRAKKRPYLTAACAALRPQFARLHLNKDWPNTVFTDKCSVERESGLREREAVGFWFPR